jgi:hypothetical protein
VLELTRPDEQRRILRGVLEDFDAAMRRTFFAPEVTP